MHVVIALVACLLLLLVSVMYFHVAGSLTLRKRIAASAHAMLVAAILPYGLLVDSVTGGRAGNVAQLPILLLLVSAAASIVYSIWALRDRPLMHLAHLFTVTLAFPLTFIGSIAIGGWT